MSLVFCNIPRRGDICLGKLSDGSIKFVRANSVTAASDIDTTTYEINGVVADVRDGKALVVAMSNENKKWAERYYFILSGYTLDGAEHTGVLNVRQSGSWGTATAVTITYNATTEDELVAQLNTFFQANEPFITQDWFAENNDGVIRLNFAYINERQVNNTGSSGFSLAANLLPNVNATASIRRRNGYTGGSGVISNYYRALRFFRSDRSDAMYNPPYTVTSIKRDYPVCLPAYLGTSSYQDDHCAILRAKYGEGENGWKEFMKSCLPVVPTDWGNMGMKNGLARTKSLATATYPNKDGEGNVLCPAANYCYSHGTTTLPAGSWWLPTIDEVYRILDGVKYSSEGDDRTLDVLNKSLHIMGGSSVSNGSVVWSCLRNSASYAWCVNGYLGYFYSYGTIFDNNLTIPVTLIDLRAD